MKLTRFFIWITAVVCLFAMTVSAQQWVNQPIGTNGAVDWSNQVIRATGIGASNPNLPLPNQRASAIRAAKLDAWRNLLETVQGVTLTSETTVENAMTTSDIIQTKVQGIVKGTTMVGEPKYLSDGSVEVTMELPLNGALVDAVLPTQLNGQPWVAGQPLPSTAQPSAAVFTGLIINAKGLGVRPAMAPKVLDEAGNEVYGSRYVSREWAVQMGMVGYDKDINRARTDDRVTNNPLVVKAIKTSGPNKADVVVSAADAAAIQGAAANQNFLDKCKVMFIVD